MKGSIEESWDRNKRLGARLRSWLSTSGPRAKLSLSRVEVAQVLKAVESERELYEYLARETGEVVSALDAHYDQRAVLETYLKALRGESVWTDDGREVRGVAFARKPHSLLRAVARRGREEPVRGFQHKRATERGLLATMHAHGFPSRDACIKYLYRAREAVREDRIGWRANIDPNFPLPSNRG